MVTTVYYHSVILTKNSIQIIVLIFIILYTLTNLMVQYHMFLAQVYRFILFLVMDRPPCGVGQQTKLWNLQANFMDKSSKVALVIDGIFFKKITCSRGVLKN